jgi:osmotically inducible protein OsmC
MTEINRKAGVLWSGDSRTGTGLISTESKALFEAPFTYQTRFGDGTGVNPEELIAAAHAACFSMSLASVLKKNGFEAVRTDTTATCTVVTKDGGHEITNMRLHVRAEAPGIDDETFQKLIMEADQKCPVSNLLKHGLKLEITATLNERIQNPQAG